MARSLRNGGLHASLAATPADATALAPRRVGLSTRDREAPASVRTANHRRFVAGFLAACLSVLAALLAFNIVIDPYALAGSGIVPTAVEPDRSIKLDLLQKLEHGPDTLILGDSRGRPAEPSFLRRLTGHGGFNAAVTGGSAPEAWVFVKYAADLFPQQRRRYIWFTSAGLAGSTVLPQLAQDPRARRYLRGIPRFGLGDVKTYLSTDATKASWRVFDKCVLGSCRSYIGYDADGSLTNRSLHYLPEYARSLKRSVAKEIGAVHAHPRTLAQARAEIDAPGRYSYFNRLLEFMNRRGEVPVIVLNPVYPSVHAELSKQGDPMHRATLEKVAQLHRHFKFVFVDCQDIHKWGGTLRDWENATHVNRANMRRMLRYIVAHSDGALR